MNSENNNNNNIYLTAIGLSPGGSEKTGTNNQQQYIQRLTVASSLNTKAGTMST